MTCFTFTGHSGNSMIRSIEEALTFDDVLLVPGYSEVVAKDVSLKTRLTRQISLNMPLVSAAMDTVTEARLAIAMAQEGGIGIIHKSMTIEQQAFQVHTVKKFEAGVVLHNFRGFCVGHWFGSFSSGWGLSPSIRSIWCLP